MPHGVKLEAGMLKALMVAYSTRLLIFLKAIVSNDVVGTRSGPPGVFWNVDIAFFRLFARWDSAYYMDIAKYWYSLGPEHWAFFPLYPILLKITSMPLRSILGIDPALAVAGFLVNHVLFGISVILLHKLTYALYQDERLAFLTCLFYSMYPGSFFYSAIYSEALFMALMLGSLYCLEGDRWLISAFLASLASLTRSIGVLLFIPILERALRSKGRSRLFGLCMSSLPIISSFLWFFYAGTVTGDWGLYLHVQSKYWGVRFQEPISALMKLRSSFSILLFTFMLLSILSILMPFIERNLQPKLIPYYLLSMAMLGIYLFHSFIESFIRYSVTLLPIYWFCSRVAVRDEVYAFILSAFFASVLAFGTVSFVNWYKFI